MITVIGKTADVAPYNGRPGFNVLDCDEYTPERNIEWLREALVRGDQILFATTQDITGIYRTELIWLLADMLVA